MKIGIFVVIAFLTAFLAGLNEISILFLIMILCFINLCYFQKHKKIYVWGLMILALGIASGAIALLAPGNTVRAVRGGTAVALTAQRMAEILLGSVAVTFYLLVEIFATTPILIVSLLYFAFLNANRDKFEKGFLVLESVPWKWVIVFLLGSTTFINIAVFKAIGVNSLTHRVQNVYVYNIILTWFFLITVFVANQRKRNFQNLFSKPVITFLTVFVFLFLLFGFELKFSKLDIAPDSNALQKAFSTIKTGSTYTNAYLDILSGRATRFERVNQERLSRIRETTASTVELPLYSFVPKTLFAQDVNHPLGYPERMIESFSGEIKPYKYTETGPPVPLKEKF